ncbi:MAG TPA: TonB-dependent receptor [Bacteroidales bacterium]|nr:TonB-dependent receptor [Bacteroidales bacterium]HQB36497.1 TonB-dependent receptor [Bacteroidales bacterium]
MKKFIWVLFITMLFTSPIQSQKRTDANIVGHVISNNEHVPFATIFIKGTTYGASTDETGHYMLVNLPVGTHLIKAQAIGFKPVEKEITIKSGETKEVNFILEEDILNLEEIVITADRSEMKRTESVTIVNTLSPRLLSSVQSVALIEGLTFSPGLRIENNCQNCGFSQVRMNGMEGPYSQILINSRPIFSGLAGVYGLELIPTNMIERIEVIRGGGSALYGSNAIAGVINIILKESISNSYEAGYSTSLTGVGISGAGSMAPDNSINLNTSLISSDNKTGISLYGFSRDRKMFDANNDAYSEIAPMSNLTVGTRFFHRFGLRSKIAIDFFNIKEQRNGGNRQEYPLHERDVAEAVKHDIKTGAVTYEQYFRDYDLLTVFASTQHLIRDSYYGANRSLKDYGRSEDLTYNTGIQYKVFLGNSSLIAGIENTGGFLTDEKLGYPDYNNVTIVNDTIINVSHSDNILISDQSSVTTGAFLQYDLKINRLKLGLGGRLDHYSIIDNAKNTEAKKGNVFSPRISLMYELFPSLQTRLSYSQGYRAPQIFDEDLHIETSGSRQVINVNDPDLKHETSHSIMTSLDFNKQIGNVSTGLLIEGFYTRLNDPFVNEIGVPDEEGKVLYTRMNAEDGAVVKGVNIEFKIKPLKEFSFTSGFTFQSSKYDIEQEFDTRDFFRTPSDYGYFNLDWDFIKNICLSVTGTYTGKMLVPYFGPLTDPDIGELRKSDPFFDLGSKIHYNIKLNGLTLQVFSGIKNIFNSFQSDFDSGIERDPAYMYGPVSPRTIYFGIKIGNKIN